MNSRHLQNIVERRNHCASAQVVFCDVQSYSQRNSGRQIEIVSRLNDVLVSTIDDLNDKYAPYAAANSIEFRRDTIMLPTGDGAAAIFTFDGLHDVHLVYATTLIKKVAVRGSKTRCSHFRHQGWCLCHPYFNLRVGVSHGDGIIYRDINGNFNIAGGVVNLASRVMATAGPNEIAFTEAAYRRYVDFSRNPVVYAEYFRKRPSVQIKHDQVLDVYIYRGRKSRFRFFDGDYKLKSASVGNLRVRGTLEITRSGSLVGDVEASTVVLSGRIKGDVIASTLVHLKRGAEVVGNVFSPQYQVDKGSSIIGEMRL